MPMLRRRRRFRVRRLVAFLSGVALALVLSCLAAAAGRSHAVLPGTGSFASSDPLLDRIWQVSIRTAGDMLVPGPIATDATGSECAIALPVVIVDGAVRDRCPYVGDQWVIGAAFDVSTPSYEVQRS